MRYASAELKGDRETMLGAATKNPHAVQHADRALRADFEVLVAAGLRAPWVNEFASANSDAE